MTAIAALPFPPLPPPPPPPCGSVGTNRTLCSTPTPPAGSCYKLGTELCGVCIITGNAGQEIVMQCNPTTGLIIADYCKSPSTTHCGGWAGADGDFFGHLPAVNLPCTSIRLDNRAGLWNISLTFEGTVRSWALAPPGYLPPGNV